MAKAKIESFSKSAAALAAFGKVLGHPARIEILRMLGAAGTEVGCMEICGRLPLSQPVCSRHISKLQAAGLVRSRPEGSQVMLRLDSAALEKFCLQMQQALHPGAAKPTRIANPRSAGGTRGKMTP